MTSLKVEFVSYMRTARCVPSLEPTSGAHTCSEHEERGAMLPRIGSTRT